MKGQWKIKSNCFFANKTGRKKLNSKDSFHGAYRFKVSYTSAVEPRGDKILSIKYGNAIEIPPVRVFQPVSPLCKPNFSFNSLLF